MTAADVTAVIGNHQGAEVLPACLESLARQTSPPAEVLVVDGASTDGSASVAERHGARFLPHPNLGLGFLYNRGVEASSTRYVLLLNNDVALDARCVELLRTEITIARARATFAVDPRQVGWDGNTMIHARTTLRRGSLLYQLIPGFVVDIKARATETTTTLCTNGAAMLVDRQMFLDLGGFDETFFLDFEDLDLGWRAWLRGLDSRHVPSAVVRHRVGAVTTDAVRPRRLISSHHNLMRFALKCLPLRDALRVLLAEAIRIAVHPRIVVPAASQIALELPEIIRERRRVGPSGDFLAWVLEGMMSAPDAIEGRDVRPG